MSGEEPQMSKERIRHCLDTLERWHDPKTGKIDGKGMMEHIEKLEAQVTRLQERDREANAVAKTVRDILAPYRDDAAKDMRRMLDAFLEKAE